MTIIENYTEGRERLTKRGLFRKTGPPPAHPARFGHLALVSPPHPQPPHLVPHPAAPLAWRTDTSPHSAVSRAPDERPGAWRWAWDAPPAALEEWGAGGPRAG